MNHLKGSHPYQCLLVTVIQVDRHITVVQPRHVHIENGSCCRSIFLFTGQPPEECRITAMPTISLLMLSIILPVLLMLTHS